MLVAPLHMSDVVNVGLVFIRGSFLAVARSWYVSTVKGGFAIGVSRLFC